MAAATRKAKATDLKLTAFQKRMANRFIVPSIALVNLALMAISLEHLAMGISGIFGQSLWIGFAAAVAIDTGMISAELVTITMGRKLRETIIYGKRYVIGTVLASMLLNSMAFYANAEGYFHQGLAITFGMALPVGIWTLTRMAGGVWLAANNRKA
jgi:hypothetical protein